MVYDRNARGTNPGDQYNRQDEDYSRDYGSVRDYETSSAREYQAAGAFNRDDDGRGDGRGRGFDRDRGDGARWGRQDYGNSGYGQSFRGRGGYGGQQYGLPRGGYDRDAYGAADHRGQRDYGRQPQGYDYDERGFFQRAGDEVRSWFGDDDAERRRDLDARHDDQRYANDRDRDYHSWRQGQVSQLDRDYDEYRRENRSKFENEFTSWRTSRQSQRDLLTKVDEHMEVVGSDGQHVGTVDKVRGDRILLTKSDKDAGGHHHSIPSSWLKSVDAKVALTKTADEAKKHWRDEERSGAMLAGDRDRGESTGRDAQGRMLNRSFSGTY